VITKTLAQESVRELLSVIRCVSKDWMLFSAPSLDVAYMWDPAKTKIDFPRMDDLDKMILLDRESFHHTSFLGYHDYGGHIILFVCLFVLCVLIF